MKSAGQPGSEEVLVRDGPCWCKGAQRCWRYHIGKFNLLVVLLMLQESVKANLKLWRGQLME